MELQAKIFQVRVARSSDRFGPVSDHFGRFWMVSDDFGRLWTVFGLFRTVSDRFRTVSDGFGSFSDRFGPFSDVFGPFSDDSIPNFQISNFHWPGLGPDGSADGRFGGPQPWPIEI